jgi:cell wall-associated NlpC family hydrolase
MEMRRIALMLAALAAVLPGPALAADEPEAPEPGNWAAAEIEQVVAAGLMAPTVEEFRPDDVLTRAELSGVLTALYGRETVLPEPERAVSVQELDRRLVRLVGLAPAARQLRDAISAAGLKPPARLGTEAVARLLGLRTNHPQAEDPAELLPGWPVTRAETAYSVARVLSLAEGETLGVAELVATFSLPELTDWQRVVLTRAMRFVGFPYIWGGSSEKEQEPFGVVTPGGFDCSGFVWRVYKLEAFADAPTLVEMLRGRTTYEMSGEVGKAARIPYEALQPADVLFFGSRGTESKPSQVGHMGIYLGNGWMVHSSSRGTTLVPLTGWYLDSFAWARRPLAEAGLEPAPAADSQPE